jgi:HAD superfamily hydrolase (TIGR01490 family)
VEFDGIKLRASYGSPQLLPHTSRIIWNMEAAFFDLDKTVIAKSSTLAFGKPFYKAGFLGRRALMKMGFAQLFYVLFGADEDQLERARDQLLMLTSGWHRAEIEQLVEQTIDEVADPIVYAEALFLIDQHKREGRRVIIVSASPEQIVRPLGRHIGVTDFIATRVKTDAAGFFLPELELYAMGDGKVEAINEVAVRDGINLEDSYAYSDSVTDLPMMEMVGNPVAVNPDKELRKVAEERDWPILEFERQVSLRTRIPYSNPWFSGATVAGVAAAVAAAILLRKKDL